MGPRFFKYRNLCGILVFAVVFTFYFIYDYVFSGVFSWWNRGVMALVFILIGGIFLALVWTGARLIHQNVSYSLTQDALVCTSWKRSTRYPFQDFRRAGMGAVSFSAPVPAVFELEDGRKLRLNQYIGELPELTMGLLAGIAPYAQIDDQLKEYVNSAAPL